MWADAGWRVALVYPEWLGRQAACRAHDRQQEMQQLAIPNPPSLHATDLTAGCEPQGAALPQQRRVHSAHAPVPREAAGKQRERHMLVSWKKEGSEVGVGVLQSGRGEVGCSITRTSPRLQPRGDQGRESWQQQCTWSVVVERVFMRMYCEV